MRKSWIWTICKRHLLQHPIGYYHVCKIQTKKIVTHPPDFEPILFKAIDQSQLATAYRDQSHHRRSLPNAAGLCPTLPITTQRHLPLPNIADHCPTSFAIAKHRRPLPNPAITQNRRTSSFHCPTSSATTQTSPSQGPDVKAYYDEVVMRFQGHSPRLLWWSCCDFWPKKKKICCV